MSTISEGFIVKTSDLPPNKFYETNAIFLKFIVSLGDLITRYSRADRWTWLRLEYLKDVGARIDKKYNMGMSFYSDQRACPICDMEFECTNYTLTLPLPLTHIVFSNMLMHLIIKHSFVPSTNFIEIISNLDLTICTVPKFKTQDAPKGKLTS